MTPATVVGTAGGDVGVERPGPADGEDEVDGAAVFDCGEGAGGGVEAGSGAGGDPLLFFVALGPEVDAVAGGVRPVADQRLEFAGHRGDDGDSGHALAGASAGGA